MGDTVSFPSTHGGKKVCLRCGIGKDYSDFCVDGTRRDGYCNYCRECKAAQKREYRDRKLGGSGQTRRVLEKIERDRYFCRGCGKEIQNRGRYYDFCIGCVPTVLTRISYCRYCGVVIKGSGKRVCSGCIREDIRRRKDVGKNKAQEYKDRLRMGGCVVCGYKKCMQALEFHHTGEKSNAISAINSVSKIVLEVENGDLVVLCSNCHREFHNGMIPKRLLKHSILKNHHRQMGLFSGLAGFRPEGEVD